MMYSLSYGNCVVGEKGGTWWLVFSNRFLCALLANHVLLGIVERTITRISIRENGGSHFVLFPPCFVFLCSGVFFPLWKELSSPPGRKFGCFLLLLMNHFIISSSKETNYRKPSRSRPQNPVEIEKSGSVGSGWPFFPYRRRCHLADVVVTAHYELHVISLFCTDVHDIRPTRIASGRSCLPSYYRHGNKWCWRRFHFMSRLSFQIR